MVGPANLSLSMFRKHHKFYMIHVGMLSHSDKCDEKVVVNRLYDQCYPFLLWNDRDLDYLGVYSIHDSACVTHSLMFGAGCDY